MDCGKFVVLVVGSVKLVSNVASNRFPAAIALVGVLCAAAPGFDFTTYGDTGVVVCETLLGLSAVSFVSTCGEGEVIAFLGDGLDGKTNGKFCEETLPFGRCLGATLVPISV